MLPQPLAHPDGEIHLQLDRQAAVHDDCVPGDERRVVRCQERHGARDVVGCPRPPLEFRYAQVNGVAGYVAVIRTMPDGVTTYEKLEA